LEDLEAPFFFEIVVSILEVEGVEVGFGEAEATDEPLIMDEGIDQVALAGVTGRNSS
jgi:hypothetical protein